MKEHIIRNITVKADELSRQYNKTKDPALREEWYQVVRSLDNFVINVGKILNIMNIVAGFFKPPVDQIEGEVTTSMS